MRTRKRVKASNICKYFDTLKKNKQKHTIIIRLMAKVDGLIPKRHLIITYFWVPNLDRNVYDWPKFKIIVFCA